MIESQITGIDWVVIGLYFGILLCVATWVVRKGKDSTADYFLAGRKSRRGKHECLRHESRSADAPAVATCHGERPSGRHAGFRAGIPGACPIRGHECPAHYFCDDGRVP